MIVFFITISRLLAPVISLYYPVLGCVCALLLDAFDFNLMKLTGVVNFDLYQQWDKFLDTYFLLYAFFQSLSWENILAKWTSIILFFTRFIGVFLFFISGSRSYLFFFPNLFEFFYVYYLISVKLIKKDSVNSIKNLLIIISILLPPKLIQEYILHFGKVNFWGWFKIIK